VKKVAAIAWLTVRESLRQKLAVNLLIFAIALITASIILSTLTYGEQYRIIVDIALSAAEIFGTLIAVFVGAGLVSREIERRTVYPVLVKPVSRGQYLFGRYLGLVAVTTGNLLLMAVVLIGVLAVYLGGFAFVWETPLVPAVITMAMQLAVVGAVSLFFSAFTTTTLAAIFGLTFTVAGHMSGSILAYWAKVSPGTGVASRVLYTLLPNLGSLDLKESVVYLDPLDGRAFFLSLGYGAVYSTIVVLLATAIFARRDLR
jgi:ABC-type transport system involved in multi-copper enzyme maturation permease subunit